MREPVSQVGEVTQMFAWIGDCENGGIIASNLPILGTTVMVAAKLRNALRLKDFVQLSCLELGCGAKLVNFTSQGMFVIDEIKIEGDDNG